MKYEVIIFDADETLFDFKKSEKVAFENMLEDFKIENSSDIYQIYHDINSAIWKEFDQGLITQEVLKVERFKRFSKQLNMELDEVALANSYMIHLANASFLYPDSLKLIEQLSKHYKLLIVTNGLKSVQEGRIKKSIIAKYFESIVISEEIKLAKPNPGIFEYALKQIHYTQKEKVLMVGDSLSSDIKGGINFKIDTCWFNPNKINNKTELKPTYEIASLLDLWNIL